MDRKVGPYQLGDSLGTLPFGELVTATHTARSEPLAILFLDDRLAKDHRFRGLLRLEIARAGAVRHAAIARAVEVGEHDGAPYVVVERPADGRTLAQSYAEGDPPSRDEAVGLIRRLAEGLDAAHSRRLVHGAIDPSSVLVGPDGTVALVGMALIGAVDEAGLNGVVAERTKSAFTAPEQRDGRRSVASADGYALGVLAAALLRVQPPPAGPADAAGTVLARQCANEPSARYPTCSAFAVALADAVAPSAQAAVDAPPAPTAAPAPNSPVAEPPGPSETPAIGALQADTVSMPLTALAPEPPVQAEPIPPAAAPTVPIGPPVMQPTPSDVGGWLRAAIDPPRPAGISSPAGLLPTSHALAPAASEVSVTTIELTPAMRAFLKPPEQRDLIGDAIAWAANHAPALDEILDRYCPDGRAGPVPLGIAVAGALALLMILAGQPWPATVLIMVVVMLYGVPRLGAALTASERANLKAVCVRGGAHIRPAAQGASGGVPELRIANNVSLSVRDAEYALLGRFGHPITVQQPVYGIGGVRDVVVGYDLPGAIVTYLSPSGTLLDVRAPDGRVLYRRPPYEGEAGDVLWSSAESEPSGDPSGTPPTGTTPMVAMPTTMDAAPASRPTATETRGQATGLPIPSAAQASLRTAAESSARLAAVIIAVPVLAFVVLPHFFGFFGLFATIVAIGIVSQGAGGTVARAFRLWNSRHATSMVRVVGPVILTRHRANKTYRHHVCLADGTKMKIDAQAHETLAHAGEVRVNEPGLFQFDWSRQTPDGYLQSEHEIPGATVTYEPTGPLLLEIRNSFGATLYREPALREGDLGPHEPRVG